MRGDRQRARHIRGFVCICLCQAAKCYSMHTMRVVHVVSLHICFADAYGAASQMLVIRR